MKCPSCSSPHDRVVNSRAAKDRRLRRRECTSCGYRWTTSERPESPEPRPRTPAEARAQAILTHLGQHPGATAKQIAWALGVSDGTVYRALGLLEAEGAVRRRHTRGVTGDTWHQVRQATRARVDGEDADSPTGPPTGSGR